VLPPFLDAETIADAPHRAVVLLSASDELSVTWSRYGAGERGPDLHVHRKHTDAFYVLTGEITFEVGPDAERVRAPAGRLSPSRRTSCTRSSTPQTPPRRG
jgi:mannose-6-phosphate isomerase-like protein (cupin superfamily)